jgi:hypothetical protein
MSETPAEPVLPDRADDDSDTGWGEPPAYDDDSDRALLDERPPHYEERE